MASTVLTVTPRGLQTEVGRIAGGEGGLIRAHNVVCRRPGLIEPRGSWVGYPWTTGATTKTLPSSYTRHVRRWDGANGNPDTFYYVAVNSGGSPGSYYVAQPVAAGVVDSFAVNRRVENARSADLGDRLAWTLDTGIGMVDEDYSFTRAAGVPYAPPIYAEKLTSGTVDQEWITTATAALAYRCVIVRTINGIPMRGPPSARCLVSGGGITPPYFVRLTIPTDMLRQGDTIEVYRTPLIDIGSYADPGDQMRLRFTVPNADSYSGALTLDDYLDDDSWTGASLYTNETQAGLAQAHWRPQYARDVALYNGMTFYAGHRSRAVFEATLRSLGDTADPERSFCSTGLDGITAIGSPTITGVALGTFAYLFPGMRVTLGTNYTPDAADATFLVDTRIVSTNSGAGTVTLSSNAQTAGVVSCIAWDWIRVNDGNRNHTIYSSQVINGGSGVVSLSAYSPATTGPTASGVFLGTSIDINTPYSGGGAFDVERAFGFKYDEPPAVAATSDYANTLVRLSALDVLTQDQSTSMPMRGIALRFTVDTDTFDEGTDTTQITLEVTTSKPLAFDCKAALDSATPAESWEDGGVSRLAYSRLDIPEAVPLVNYVDIGGPRYPIRRIVATTDSLWVLKGDGVWRVYGDTPETLEVQQVDPTVTMFATSEEAEWHRWVTKLGDTVFAWTSGGIFAMSANGVQRIDGPIQTLVRKYTPPQLEVEAATSPWSFSDLRSGLVGFGVIGQTLPTEGSFAFVYAVDSGTWQTWSLDTYDGSTTSTQWTIGGDGEDPSGAALCGGLVVLQNAAAGEVLACPWGYIENPYLNEAAGEVPTATTDHLDYANATGPNVTGTFGASVTLAANILPVSALGGAWVDASGDVFYTIARSSSTEITADRTGVATGAPQFFGLRTARGVTYAAHTEGLPMVEKYYREIYVNFQVIHGYDEISVSTRAYNSTTTTTQTVGYDEAAYLANILEWQPRIQVPREQTRAIGLQVAIDPDGALSYWQLGALAVTYEPTTERTGAPRV